MKRFSLLVLLLALLEPSYALASLGRRIGRIIYAHSTVGTTAQDALPAVQVDRSLVGWRVCHDAGSTATYLAMSTGADPATDGLRIAAGQCYQCDECGAQALIDLNVKADAASTGYSVLQLK
jgi:hypothetical protein